LNHSKIENDYKIGKTKLFLRYWHIDILNQLSKKYLNQIIMAQKSKDFKKFKDFYLKIT
jgi:predicted nucleic acid-binding OB-fold protein